LATFALIHGAGDVGWYWHLVEAELRRRGHETVAPDLPCEDDSAGLSAYADTVIDAIGNCTELVIVAQSFGAFTAPLVCDRVDTQLLVLLAGLVPAAGERAEDWWTNTGYEREPREHYDDMMAVFYHDVPTDLAEEAIRRGRTQSETPNTRTVAVGRLAQRADPVPALSRGPAASRRFPTPRRSGAPRDRPRRD
jgi:hypothetical protein